VTLGCGGVWVVGGCVGLIHGVTTGGDTWHVVVFGCMVVVRWKMMKKEDE